MGHSYNIIYHYLAWYQDCFVIITHFRHFIHFILNCINCICAEKAAHTVPFIMTSLMNIGFNSSCCCFYHNFGIYISVEQKRQLVILETTFKYIIKAFLCP